VCVISISVYCSMILSDGLVETGIPQIMSISSTTSILSGTLWCYVSWTVRPLWFASLPTSFYEIVSELNFTTSCHKLTSCILLQQDDWEQSEWKQLYQYEQQFMFGIPCPIQKHDAVLTSFGVILSRLRMAERKLGTPAINPLVGGVRVLDYTHMLIALTRLGLRSSTPSLLWRTILFSVQMSRIWWSPTPQTRFLHPSQ
jgi:hypothetical protein